MPAAVVRCQEKCEVGRVCVCICGEWEEGSEA